METITLTELERRVARKMLEAELQQNVNDMLSVFGWVWCHFRPARTSEGWRTALSGWKGFPDVCAIRAPRLLFIELKRESEQPDADQAVWHREVAIVAQGVRAAMAFAKPMFMQNLSEAGLAALDLSVEMHVWRPSDWLSGEIERVLR